MKRGQNHHALLALETTTTSHSDEVSRNSPGPEV